MSPRTHTQLDLPQLARWLVAGGEVDAAASSWEHARALVVQLLLLSRIAFLVIPLGLMWQDGRLTAGMAVGMALIVGHGIWLLATGGSALWAIAIDVPFLTFAVISGEMGSISALLLVLYLTVARIGLGGWQRTVGTLLPSAGLVLTSLAQTQHPGILSYAGTMLGVLLVALAVIRVLEMIDTYRANAAAEAEARAEARLQTLAMVAHELSTPLTTGAGALSLLQEEDLPPDQRELVDLVSIALHDSGILVSDLRSAAELDRETLTIQPTCFALSGYGQELARTHPTSNLVIDIPAGDAFADRTRVAQIVHNLVGNAERHGRPPIRIEATCDGTSWRITVTDEGEGIPIGERESIFESFSQGSHHGEGMGLGLAVSRRLARAMGGDLEVDASVQNTRFALTIPAHPPTDRLP